ncbi:hypothetical protein [Actinomadura sp. BRA 177]|uniref:hypothetical protein n=1 Tax=Actinomadura sp. BRA 177 TaxID=2745202 RepID=UPI0015962EA3|nr:hypothetical protein [Actinomadura sp. BRA 177]NVI88966.1 hypothetical protein [Actinomadura sp. BRA 177]
MVITVGVGGQVDDAAGSRASQVAIRNHLLSPVQDVGFTFSVRGERLGLVM